MFNIYTGQLKGPFIAGEELFTKIQNDAAIEVSFVKHLGVQADKGSIISINNKNVEIGETGIYEIGNTEIKSLIFTTDMAENTIIDYTIQ